MRIRHLTKSALMAAVLCVISPVAVPLGAVPLSFATFGVYLSAIILKPADAVLSVVVYVLIGAFGLPVFSGANGGFGVIAGPTGGYIVGYILCVWIVSVLKNKINVPAALLAGTVVLYFFGTAWFMFITECRFFQSVAVCVLPFLLGDVMKIIAATVADSKIRRIL